MRHLNIRDGAYYPLPLCPPAGNGHKPASPPHCIPAAPSAPFNRIQKKESTCKFTTIKTPTSP